MSNIISVDGARSQGSKLPTCSCGWRGWPTTALLGAWTQARQHEMEVHPGNVAAARNLDATRARLGSA